MPKGYLTQRVCASSISESGGFVVEALFLSILVGDRLWYWRQNWLNLLIVIGGIPLLFEEYASALALLRILRLVILLALVLRFARRFLELLARHALLALLIVELFLVLAVGTLVASIDPNVHTLWDGIWWAVVTVSTVGYGDVVPTSPAGRLLGIVLILFGVVTFSLLTATLAKAVLNLAFEETARELEREEVKHELLILQRLAEMQTQIEHLHAAIALLQEEKKEREAPSNRGSAEGAP